ncbi:hypothetical protein D3C84_1117630 [compost metagenome]
MDLGTKPQPLGCCKDATGLLHGENALLAEDIAKLRKSFLRYSREHLVNDVIHVRLSPPFKLRRDGMGSHKCRHHIYGMGVLQAACDAQLLQLVL